MKIKEIKIREDDGSYSDPIPVGVDFVNVDTTNGSNLKIDLDNINKDLDNKTNQIDNLKNKDISLQNQINSLASGSPKGTYVNAAAIKTANPDTGVYIVTDNGHIYSWTKNSTSDPVDLGVYQATEIADGSVTVAKTNFINTIHINHFKVRDTNSNWHGVNFECNVESGLIEANGTCTENTNFMISNGDDYYLEPGEYVFDLNVLSGSISSSVGVSIYANKEDGTLVTLCNVGSETLPKKITITENVKIRNVNLWTTTGKIFTNWIIFPQLQKGTSIVRSYPHNLYELKNHYDNILDIAPEVDNILNNKNKTELLVPSKLRYLPNREISIYYDNILYNGDDKEIFNHQSWNNFTHYDNCYRFKNAEVSNIWENIIFNKSDLIRTQISHGIQLIGVPTDAGSGVTKKCLFIGDSLTDLGHYTQELLNLFENDVMNIELLGTRGTDLNKHEGRANWSAYSYTHNATYAGLTNPFFNTTTNSFDFTKYMNDNNYVNVDIVSIALGTNDRGVIGSTEEEIRTNLRTMVTSIKNFDSNIKILLLLPPPICKVGYDYINWNTSIKVANRAIIKEFDSKESENIYIVPTFFNIDPVNDYTMKTIPKNSRSSEVKTVVKDPVHPNVIGFQHMADMIFPVLKYLGGL